MSRLRRSFHDPSNVPPQGRLRKLYDRFPGKWFRNHVAGTSPVKSARICNHETAAGNFLMASADGGEATAATVCTLSIVFPPADPGLVEACNGYALERGSSQVLPQRRESLNRSVEFRQGFHPPTNLGLRLEKIKQLNPSLPVHQLLRQAGVVDWCTLINDGDLYLGPDDIADRQIETKTLYNTFCTASCMRQIALKPPFFPLRQTTTPKAQKCSIVAF